MKRFLIIMLTFVVCIMLCACSEEPEILGEWRQFTGGSVHFNDDGTGTIYEHDEEYPLKWKYNSEDKIYSIFVETNKKTYETEIESDGIKDTISFAGRTYFRMR